MYSKKEERHHEISGPSHDIPHDLASLSLVESGAALVSEHSELVFGWPLLWRFKVIIKIRYARVMLPERIVVLDCPFEIVVLGQEWNEFVYHTGNQQTNKNN
jgi:hypothetical protein